MTVAVTLVAMADAWVSQNLPKNDYSIGTIMKMESQNGNKNRRSLVRFDPSSIQANSTIVSATLRLYASAAPSASRSLTSCSNQGGVQRWDYLREPVANRDIINKRYTACLERLFSLVKRFVFGQGAEQS